MARSAQVVEEQEMVEILYNGPVGTHLVPSPSRKVANYGLHTRDEAFFVHVADQEQQPTKFVLKNPPKAEKVMLAEPAPVEDVQLVVKEVTEEPEAAEEVSEVVTEEVEEPAKTEGKAKPSTTKAKPAKGNR